LDDAVTEPFAEGSVFVMKDTMSAPHSGQYFVFSPILTPQFGQNVGIIFYSYQPMKKISIF
jgi:hypothetical protein